MKKVFLVFVLVAAYGVSIAMSGVNVVTVNDQQVTIVADMDDNNVTAPAAEKEKEKATKKEAKAAKSEGCATAKADGCASAKSEGCATAKTEAKSEGCATAKAASCCDKSKTATAEKK
jgi:flagellar biosynthesis/type III secretory pathway protein FliH